MNASTIRQNQVASDEDVARILAKEWFVNDKLNAVAFTLDLDETYLSVNRPKVESFIADVESFVKSHSGYSFDNGNYRLALLNVGGIRAVDVSVGDAEMKIDVEVEPRDARTKSHAGIFTRFQNKNVKRGQLLKAGPTAEEISADTILLEVRSELLALSTVEQCQLNIDEMK